MVLIDLSIILRTQNGARHRFIFYNKEVIVANSIIRKFFLLSPAKLFTMEWSVLFISGISFLFINNFEIRFFPIINILGLCLFSSAMYFHIYCERVHKQAHEHSEKINKIITISFYSKIRHPLYLSLIVMNIGIGLSFGSLVTIILSLIFSIFAVITALYEEEYLSQKFPDYLEYKKRVPWRMIPHIF